MSEMRRKARQMKLVSAGMLVARKCEGLDTREAVEHVRIAAMAAIAECRGMWAFLVERGIATQGEREDYLDKGYELMLAQVEQRTSDVMVFDGSPN